MTKRNPLAVFVFGLITLGIYSWYWAVKTKGELNKLGTQKIPTAWIWLIPVVGYIWWAWKYSVEVEEVTHEKLSAPVSFLVLYFLSFIGQAIIQDYYNKLGDAAVPATNGPAPTASPTPDSTVQATPNVTQPVSSPEPSTTTVTPTSPPEASSATTESSSPSVVSPTQPEVQENTPTENPTNTTPTNPS